MTTPKSMSLPKILFIVSIFFLILTGIRFAWFTLHKTPPHPDAEAGVIDLSEWEFTNKQTITLDGDWEFYPNELINPDDNFETYQEERTSIIVPGVWEEALHKHKNLGYGTYRLQIKLPEDRLYGLTFQKIFSAANIYVNGKLLVEASNSDTNSRLTSKPGAYSTRFFPQNNRAELIIQVTNDDFPFKGGITDSIKIGTDTAIIKEANMHNNLQIIVGIIFLLHCLYAVIIYVIGKGKYQKELLYYGIFLFISAFAILIDDAVVLELPIHRVFYYKLLLFLFVSVLYVLLLFVRQFFTLESRFFKYLTIQYSIIVLGEVFLPFMYFEYLFIVVACFYLTSMLFLFIYTIKTVQKGYPDAIFILLFITSYTSNVIWGFGVKLDFIEVSYYPYDFLISIMIIAILLFKRHSRMVRFIETQTKELKRADKVKDEFLVNTSHEIRNPLHGIINISQSLLDNEAGNLTDKQQANLALLVDIGQNMSATLHDLSIVTQLQEGEIQLHKKPVNLSEVANMIIDMLDYMKEGKPITLHSYISSQAPRLCADENRLIQILFNLVHNAIKYTQEGSVTIDADFSNKMATVYVRDTGNGIPFEYRDKIFLPYERIHDNFHAQTSGIGVGLHITKQLVELHGGEISFTTTNAGTVFFFSIPLLAGQSVHMLENVSALEIAASDVLEENSLIYHHAQDEEYEDDYNKTKGKLLLVDDDPVNIKVLSEVLTQQYQIITALHPNEALQKLEQHQFDLIISDVMMPGMSGYELTKKIRQHYTISELPIILITARDLPKDIHVAFDSGANDYLTKPINALELRTRVKSLTDLKKSVKERLSMEAAWLQAQIQPHFLFNTLNSIASLAMIDTNRMVALLEAFGNYLERSFSVLNVELEIPLSDALSLTNAYVHIEKERFGQRLHVEFDIDEVGNLMIPPLSIQPLVENAINHGVLVRNIGGKVTLTIKEHDTSVEITVKDDGVGMSEDKITALLDLKHSLGEGVGVKNTNRRLIQLYGKGLTITSKQDEGTTVSFHIPK